MKHTFGRELVKELGYVGHDRPLVWYFHIAKILDFQETLLSASIV
jgi:hypothetical protein